MNNNLRQTVIDAIAKTQDGGALTRKDEYSSFMLNSIEDNNMISDEINIEGVVSNFRYMIDQLKKALVPLEQYINE